MECEKVDFVACIDSKDLHETRYRYYHTLPLHESFLGSTLLDLRFLIAGLLKTPPLLLSSRDSRAGIYIICLIYYPKSQTTIISSSTEDYYHTPSVLYLVQHIVVQSISIKNGFLNYHVELNPGSGSTCLCWI